MPILYGDNGLSETADIVSCPTDHTLTLLYWKISLFAAYTIYKGRGAMSLKIIKPTWERTPNGNGIRVAREGTMLLEFAQSKGERVYDWENKGTFAMSAVECGEILEACESGEERSFFHDPNKMGMTEGTINKTLKFSPARDSGYFFSLYINDKSTGGTSRFDTAVSSAELRVIQNLLDVRIANIYRCFSSVQAAW